MGQDAIHLTGGDAGPIQILRDLGQGARKSVTAPNKTGSAYTVP